MTSLDLARAWTVLVLAILPATTSAQKKAAPVELLSVTTTWHEPVWRVLDWLPVDADIDVPDVVEGDALVLRYTSDRRLTLRVEANAGAKRDLLRVRMRPARLKPVLHEGAGLVTGLFRALTFTFFVNKWKAEPRYVARAMYAVTNFPLQVDSLSLRVTKRPNFAKGYLIDLEAAPVAGSWFGRVLAGLEPSGRGAHLMRTPKAALSVAAAVAGPTRDRLLAPFARSLANLRGRSKKERAAFRELVAARIRQFDGSFSLLIDGPGRYVRLVGLGERQAAAFRDAAFGSVGTQFDTRRVGRPPIVYDSELPRPLREASLRQASLRVLRRELDVLEAMTAEAKAELWTFGGVVRDFSIKVRLPKDGEEVRKLVDRIENGRLRRAPLLERALLMAELHFGDALLRKTPRAREFMEELGGLIELQPVLDALAAAPEHIEVGVYKGGTRAKPGLRVRAVTR